MSTLTEDIVLDRCRFFTDVHLWPLRAKLDPALWLDNFLPDEKEYALHLLAGFTYLAEPLIEEMFSASFLKLSEHVITIRRSYPGAISQWRRFMQEAVIVRVTGERPNDSDSGYRFARMARQKLGVPEHNILSPENAIDRCLKEPDLTIVFVDDFAGSGEQFCKSWKRKYDSRVIGRKTSFDEIALRLRSIRAFYCPVVITEFARARVETECSPTQVMSANVLQETANILHPKCPIWPDALRPNVESVIRQVSHRAGVSFNPGQVDYWKGFHSLGLALGFEHCVPDASLPIFYWERNGWHPLLRRT